MAQKRHRVDQIISKLRRADVELGKGKKVPEVCKLIGISEQTYYRWRQKYGGMQPEMAKELKALQNENARLKKMVAEQALDMEILKEAAKGNYLVNPERRRRTTTEVRRRLGPQKVSERRACRVLDQPRSTQRYPLRRVDDEPRLLREMRTLARQRPRFGAQRIVRVLVERHWQVNHKRVHRLWKRENMQVPRK